LKCQEKEAIVIISHNTLEIRFYRMDEPKESLYAFFQQAKKSPKTGEDLMLEPRRVVKFRATEALREKLNGKG